jgi:cell division protein FtsL
MEELLTKFSLTEIVIFICLLLAAIKTVWETLESLYTKIRKLFDKQYKEIQEKKDLSIRLEKCEKNIEMWETQSEKLLESISALKTECQKSFDKQNENLELLINSDKDDIKSFIVREYHYFVEKKKWIDDFSMDVLEKRYAHYCAEHGNSYVEDLMRELRKLPHQPQK